MEENQSLELLVQRRAEGEQLDEDLQFLNELSGMGGGASSAPQPEEPTAPKPKKEKPKKPETSAGDPEADDNFDLGTPGATGERKGSQGDKQRAKPADDPLGDLEELSGGPAKESPGVLTTAAGVAKDIGGGLIELPEQAVGGVFDAVDAMIGIGDMIQEFAPMPGLRLFDLQGNFDPKLVDANEIAADMNARRQGEGRIVPSPVGQAETVTGGMINGVSQFLTGFVTGGHVLRGIGAAGKLGFVGRATTQGMFSDFAAFDGHEERLSNLIQDYPTLANPVTEYLSADPEDTEAEGRLKSVMGGMIPDAMFTGLLSALRAMKKARLAKAGLGSKSYVQAADALANEISATGKVPVSGAKDPLSAIGDSTPGAPLVVKGKLDPAKKVLVAGQGKLRVAEKAAEGAQPKDALKEAGSDLAGKVPVGETFINFAKINSADDIKAVIKGMAKQGAPDIEAARRGVRTNAQTIAAAGKKYDQVWTDLIARRTGELTFNAEEQLALRQLWNTSGQRLMETAKLAEAAPTAENLLSFRKMLMIHKTVQDQAMAVRTETARALQQWNIPAGVAGKDKVNAMHAILLQHGGADVNIDLARKFAGLADEVAANPNAMEKLTAATEKSAGATTLKAINEAWIGISLLSGPKTHVRNMISNMGMMAASVAERAIASRVGGILDDVPAVEIGEASQQVAGMFANVRQAWSDAATTFKTGLMKEGMSQIDIPLEMAMRSLDQNTLLGKSMYALSYAAQPVFRGLMASDQLFKTLNYGGEIRALAYREATRMVRDGEIPRHAAGNAIADMIRNPPPQIAEAAREAAAIRTFTNEPGKLTKFILRGRNEFPLARFIIPFVNTPSNVFRTSIEYSPLAPVLSKYRNAVQAGGPQAALARTKLSMGTAAMLEMINLTMDGKLTGSGPEPGTAEYEALKRTGWKPYSVRIGDHWVSYRGVEPFSTVMGMGADIGDYVRYSEDDISSAEAIKDMMAVGVFSVADNMLDRAFLKGLADTFGAINDPDMNAAKFTDSFASSFVPRALTEVRYATDSTVRDARTMMDSFKSRIPYMSMTVPERRDEWGRVQSMESGWGKAYDTLSPFYATPIGIEPIDRELLQQGFGLGHANRSITLQTVSVSLRNRADIHNRFLELRGQTTASELSPKLARKYGDQTMLDVLNDIVTGNHALSAKYEQGSDGDKGGKHRLLQKVVRDFGREAREKLVDEFPEIRLDVEREKGQRLERARKGRDEFEDELESVE